MALKFEITGDNRNFLDSLDGARDGVRRVAQDIEQSGMSIEDMFKRIGAAAGIAFSLDQAKSFVSKITEVRSFFQDIESSMEVFLGNQQKAAEFTDKLKDYAYYNMFEFKYLADASKQMIAYGHAIDDIIPRLDQLSNIATGTKADLMEMVDLYNRAKSLGEVGSQSLASWATKGLVVKDVLKEMGEEVDGTTVTFEQLNMVLDKVTGEGGMFHDLMLNQMSNISAEQGQLEDNLAAMYNEIGEQYQDFITGAIKAESWLVEHYKEVGSVILGLVAAYGEYQAALRVTRAIENTMTKQANEIEAQRQNELQQIYDQYSKDAEVASEEASTASIVQNTASREGNVTAIDNQIAALERKMLAEIEEQNNVVNTAKEALNALKMQEAQKDSEISTLKEQIDTTNEFIDGEKEALESALKLGDAEQVEALKTNIATESKRLETLQEELGAAQKEKNIIADQKHSAVIATKTALTQKKTMQERLANMQQAVNVTQTKAQTAATGLWVAVTKSATAALQSLKVALATNPFGIALAAITTIISLLPIFTDETSSAAEEIERFGESAVKQTRNLETLMAVVDSTSSESKVHKDAVDELAKIYEEYGYKIDDEIDKLQQLKDMHDLVTEAIHKEGEERQKANLLQSYNDALEEATKNMRDALQTAFESAEWENSTDLLLDDFDADEYQERAKELTQIIGAIIQSESESLANLTGEELEAKIQEVHERIQKAYTDMGLDLERTFSHGEAGAWASPVDVHDIDIINDYVDAIHSVTQGRNALLKTFDEEKKAHPEIQKEIDYTTMSIADLVKKTSEASGEMSDLGDQNVSPEVDKTSIDNATDAAGQAKKGIDLLNGMTAKPLIDTTSIGLAIGQTNTLLGNMFRLSQIGGGQSTFSLGFNPNKFGFGQAGSPFSLWGNKKPVWGTIGGKAGIQWIPNIPITDPALLAQNELDSRVNGANTQKKVDDLLKDVNDALSKAVFDSPEYKSLEALKKRLEAKSRKGSKGSRGSKGGKSQAEKIADQTEKVEELEDNTEFDRIRAAQDLERRVTDATIAAKTDGAERIRLAQEQQNKEELEDIDRQGEDAVRRYIEQEKKLFEEREKLKKAKNPKYKEQKFDESLVDVSAIREQYAELRRLTQERQEAEQRRENLQSMRKYLKEYGDELQQEVAITEDYQERIAEARAKGNEGEALLLEKKMQEELSAMRLTNLRNSAEYIRAFEDLGNTSNETLKALIKRFEDAKEAAAKSLDPHQLREYTETLQQMYDELDNRNPFESLTNALKELADAQKEVKSAQDIYNKVKAGEVVINQTTGNAYTEAEASERLANAKDREAKVYNKLTKASLACADKLNQFAATLNKLGDMVGGALGDSLGALGGVLGSVGSAFENIKNINVNATGIEKALGQFSAVTGTVSAMVEMNRQLDKLLPDTESLYEHYAAKQRELNEKHMRMIELEIEQLEQRLNAESWFYENGLTQLKKNAELNAQYAKAYGEVAAMPQEIYQNASSGFSKWAPAILGAIVGIVAGVLTFGAGSGAGAALGAAIGSAIGGTAIGAALGSTVVAMIGTAIFSGVGAALGNAVRAGIDGITYDEGQTAAINNMRVQTRHKTFFRSEKTQDLQSWVKENWGQDLFEDVKGVQLIDPEVAKKLLEDGPTLVGETRETLEKLLEYSEKIREFIDQIHEYVSEAFSPLVDNLADALWDWLTDGKDVLDSFREYAADTFKNIAQDALKAMITKNIFEPFQEQLENLTIAYSTGQIDETAYMAAVSAFAQQAQDSIQTQLPVLQNAAEVINMAMQNAGIDMTGKNTYQQEASKGGWGAMSEDTGGELNGRFTALQIAGENISEGVSAMLGTLAALSTLTEGGNITLVEIRNLMITNNAFLEDILSSNKEYYKKFNTQLDKIVTQTK